MSFLALIPLRAWAIMGAAAALALLLWHDHHMSRLFKAERQRTVQLAETLDTERKNAAQVRADLTLNQVTSHALQERLSAVERERRDTPLPRLRCTARVSGTAAESGSPGGSDGAAARRESEAIAFDPSADLDEYGADCAVIAERLSALQVWELSRKH